MNDRIFLDGLSLTLLGVPQNQEIERDFIFHMSSLLEDSVLEFRESGAKGYPLSAVIKGTLPNGFEWTVFCAYGSMNRGQHMNIEAKGQITEIFKEAFLTTGVAWSLTRADIAMDMVMDYEEGHEICQRYAKKKNIATSLVGDWEGKTNGRTYYIGASRSNCESFMRFYEKGIEMTSKGFNGYPANLVRLELEFKPYKHKREQITSLNADHILSFAVSPLELFNTFLDLGITPVRVSGKKDPDYRRAVEHMVTQYANSIKAWHENEPDGLKSLFKMIIDASKG